MNWGMMTRAERDAAYNNTDAVKNSTELNEARITASAAFRQAHSKHLDLRYGPRERNTWDLFPADRSQRALHRLHPWRLLAAQQQGPVRQPDRRTLRARLGGGAAGLHPGARRLAHRDRGRDQRSARLAGRQRCGARHQRQGRAVGLVGRRPSDGGLPRPCPRERGPRRSPASSSSGRSATPISTKSSSLSDTEIETLSPLRLPMVNKPLAITYGTAELPPLVADSRASPRQARRRAPAGRADPGGGRRSFHHHA